MSQFTLPSIYAITDSRLMRGEQLRIKAEALLTGGCKLIQYRDKSQNTKQRVTEASQLRELCHNYNAQLIINDDIDLAHAVAADGVHLGQGDRSISDARALLGANAIIGKTCHNRLNLAQTAIDEGADYIAFGRFFSSNTKPSADSAPLDLIQQAQQHFDTPTVVIGGICRDNAAQIIQAGAKSLAISHGLLAADDITAETQYLQSLFG